MYGDGSAETPWGIESYEDLQAVAADINGSNTVYQRAHRMTDGCVEINTSCCI